LLLQQLHAQMMDYAAAKSTILLGLSRFAFGITLDASHPCGCATGKPATDAHRRSGAAGSRNNKNKS